MDVSNAEDSIGTSRNFLVNYTGDAIGTRTIDIYFPLINLGDSGNILLLNI